MNVVEGWVIVVIGYVVVKTVVLVVINCPEERDGDVEGLEVEGKVSIVLEPPAPAPPEEGGRVDKEDISPPLLDEEGYCVGRNVDPPLVVHHCSL